MTNTETLYSDLSTESLRLRGYNPISKQGTMLTNIRISNKRTTLKYKVKAMSLIISLGMCMGYALAYSYVSMYM